MKKNETRLAGYPSISDPRQLPFAPLFLVRNFQFMLNINLKRFG